MSPVAISGVDKQGVDVNGVQVKQNLSAANSTVNKGVYDATLLETVDPDLAAANILQPVEIFGKVGTVVAGVDVSDADALVTDVKDPKTFYSVAAPRKTGTMPTVAIVAANDNYPAGYHAGNVGGLDAIDLDLASANIKSGVTIFGKAGTVIPQGTETITKYADAVLAAGVTYTPAASGVFFLTSYSLFSFRPEFNLQYYSTVATAWYYLPKGNVTSTTGFNAIGDGTNFRIINSDSQVAEYCLMRHYYSTGTYTREKDEQLANGTAWTPAVSGFFSSAVSLSTWFPDFIQLTTNGWQHTENIDWLVSGALKIGDGTNYRVYNDTGGARYHVTMRVKLI